MKKIIIGVLLVFLVVSYAFLQNKNQYYQRKINFLKEEIENINTKKKYYLNYNDTVLTNKNTALYEKKNNTYRKTKMVSQDFPLSLELDDQISDYYKLKNKDYYIPIADVIKEKKTVRKNYQNYISFGKVHITKGTRLNYNSSYLELPEDLETDVLVKLEKEYGIVYNEKLRFVSNESLTLKEEEKEFANEIAVLNYHFFYNKEQGETCNEVICITTQQFEEQLNYLGGNGYYAPTMQEFEWFMDKKVRLPKKSVLLTIDDGAFGVASHAMPMLEKHKMQATLFLITSWFDYKNFQSDYLELHSHSNNMHNTKVCPGGQGGGIKCLPREFIQKDLKITRDLLNNTTAFAYPFYEYNEYAIENLKEAGFTMAFRGGGMRAKAGSNKMLIPRFGIDNKTSVEQIKQMLGPV